MRTIGGQDVDSTDKGVPGNCTGTVSGACCILDLDFDGDYDSTDATKFDSLPQGLAGGSRQSGRRFPVAGAAPPLASCPMAVSRGRRRPFPSPTRGDATGKRRTL